MATAVWARHEDDAAAKLKAINGPIHKVRGRIEKIFGTCKHHYGLRRMVHRRIVKATLQVLLTAIAYKPQAWPQSTTGLSEGQPGTRQRPRQNMIVATTDHRSPAFIAPSSKKTNKNREISNPRTGLISSRMFNILYWGGGLVQFHVSGK